MIPHSFLNVPSWNICGVHHHIGFLFSICSLGYACITHICTHQHRWAQKLLRPSCLTLVRHWGLPNCKCIRLLHSQHFPIVLWCVPHHCASVASNAHCSASYSCYSGIALANLSKNSSTIFTTSYVGSSLAFIITHCSDIIIMFQFSVVTLCNQFY